MKDPVFDPFTTHRPGEALLGKVIVIPYPLTFIGWQVGIAGAAHDRSNRE